MDAVDTVPRLIAGAISGALTGFFAFGGAFSGAAIGALAGRASDSGVLRGAGLGAIAGAVLSVEILEASRAYWCLQQTGFSGSTSMVSVADINYDEIHGIYGEFVSRGLSGNSLNRLPCHVMLDENKETILNCTICLQDIKQGELVRSLPNCQHMFHLVCADKWLIRQGSCPVCRQDVQVL